MVPEGTSMDIRVGTASWTDPTLIACKRFYPPGCTTAEARLRFYASQFPVVEVDASYYALPNPQNSRSWAERTPDGFTMDIKAFRLLTGHQTEPRFFPKDLQGALPKTGSKNLYYRDLPDDMLDELWRRFFEAIEPLRAGGRLGAVLFQFAPWITTARDNFAHVAHCADRMRPYLTAFEFRNKSWLDDKHRQSVLDFEREHGLVHVIMDAPEGVTGRAQTVWEVTSPELALVRLHGRNAATWSGSPSAAARFDYDYSDEELTQLAVPIREIACKAARTHVIFNNCFEDFAQRNARSMMRLLGSGNVDAVAKSLRPTGVR